MSNLSDKEILNFALQNGIIDVNTIQMQIEMKQRKKYLDMHKYNIWQGKNGMWYTYLPDEKKGRCLKKRKTQKDIENCVVDYWENNCEEIKEKKIKEKITLYNIFPEWLNYKQIHTNSTSYIKRITADWKRFYVPEKELINTPICKFSKVFFDTWAHGMIKKYDMTKKQYYNMSMIIRQCLDYAVENRYIEVNEFADVCINTKLFRRTKKKSGETQVYNQRETEELIQDMIRRFKNNMSSTAPLTVMFAFETGVRIGELCALKFSDIEGNYIHIQRQEVREFEKVDDYTMKFKCFKVVEYTKSDDGYRDVYLTETARKIIEVAKIANQKSGQKNPDNFIFCKDGKNVNHYSIQAMIKRGCESIDMQIKTSHKIRKTYISTLIDSGLNIDEIRRTVGHSDERTTYSNYCFNRLEKKETEEVMENALSNNQKVIKGNQLEKIVQFSQPA